MEVSLLSWLSDAWRFTRSMKEPDVSSEIVNNINASKILGTDILVSIFVILLATVTLEQGLVNQSVLCIIIYTY